MAKQKITDTQQRHYDKPQFQIGSAVFFSWLGCKQYGYVTKFKKVGWGIMYTVESVKGTKYPCGIEIKGQKTHYNTGCIYVEETRSIGEPNLVKRIQMERESARVKPVVNNPVRSTYESRSNSELRNRDDSEDSGKDTKPKRKKPSTDLVATPSAKGVDRLVTKKRRVSTNKELDSAIEKQRNFLSGFVKKD
tara:strand:- start:2213 stop:2788 length:576 start_codon:yes stop_codon:yes gene_type:complete